MLISTDRQGVTALNKNSIKCDNSRYRRKIAAPDVILVIIDLLLA